MNNYGNYVVQKSLKLSSKEDKILLINNIYKNIDKIKDKKLNLKWKSIIESNLEGTFEVLDERIFEKRSKTGKSDINKYMNRNNNMSQRDYVKPSSMKNQNRGEIERHVGKKR